MAIRTSGKQYGLTEPQYFPPEHLENKPKPRLLNFKKVFC